MKKKIKIILILILLGLFSYFFSKVCIFTLDMVKNKHIQKYLIKEVINVTINKDTNEEEFTVDFPKLIEKNKDTVGWIRYNNDKINYPILIKLIIKMALFSWIFAINLLMIKMLFFLVMLC